MSAKEKKKKNRRRRRLVGILVALVVLAVLFRLGLQIALPSLIDKALSGCGMACAYRDLDLSLLGGDVELWNLDVVPKEGGGPWLRAEYCRADLDFSALVLGRVVVNRLEVDGMDAALSRSRDGVFDLAGLARGRAAERKEEGASAVAEEGKTPSSRESAPLGESPGPIDFTLPIEIRAVRLQHVLLRVRDESVDPPIEARFDADLRVSGLGSKGGWMRFEASLAASPFLEELSLEGSAFAAGGEAKVLFGVRFRGLDPRRLAPYLEPMGIHPVAGEIEGGFHGRVEAEPAFPYKNAVRCRAAFEDFRVVAGGAEAAGLDRVVLEADAVGPGFADLSRILVEGGRARAARRKNGALLAAGLEFRGPVPGGHAEAKGGPVVQRRTAAEAGIRGRGQAPGTLAGAEGGPAGRIPAAKGPAGRASHAGVAKAFAFRLGELAVKGIDLSFHDEAVAPPVRLGLVLDEFSLEGIAADPRGPAAEVSFACRLGAPGLVKTLTLKGRGTPFAAWKRMECDIDAAGIAPEAARPYLEAAGLTSLLSRGTLSCRLEAGMLPAREGAFRGDISLEGLRFEDGGELFGLDGARLAGIDLDGEAGRFAVEEILFTGARMDLRREASGALAMLGFRFGEKRPPAVEEGAGRAGTAAPAGPVTKKAGEAIEERGALREKGSPSPRVEVGRFLFEGGKVRFRDEAVRPAALLTMADAQVEVTDFVFDPDRPAGRAPPAAFRVRFGAPGTAERITVAGTVVPDPAKPAVAFDVTGEGVTGRKAAPYLEAAGLELPLKDGRFAFHAGADLDLRKEDLGAVLAIRDLSFSDGEKELAGLDRLAVEVSSLGRKGLDVKAVEIAKPRLKTLREKDGSLVFAGVRVRPGPRVAPSPEGSPPLPPRRPEKGSPPLPPRRPGKGSASPPRRPEKGSSSPPGRHQEGGVPLRPPAGGEPAAPFPVALDRFRVEGARVLWEDRALPAPAVFSALADVDLDGLVLGRDGGPARFRAALEVPEALQDLTLAGSFSILPDGGKARLSVDASGIRGEPLAAYLPPGIRPALADGRFEGTIDVGFSAHSEGGRRGFVGVEKVVLRDGEEGPVLLKVGDFKTVVSRFDPGAGIVAVEEVTLDGLEAAAARTPGGGMRLPGLLLEPPPPGNVGKAPEKAESSPPSRAAEVEGAARGASAAELPSPAAVRRPAALLPRVTLERLDLRASSLSFRDETRPGASPAELSDLRVRNEKPIELLGDEPESLPPASIVVTGSLPPAAGAFEADLEAAPFAPEPEASLRIEISGIDGRGLESLLPGIEEKIDAASLDDGLFQGSLRARLKSRRRGPLDFDLSKGFGLDAVLDGFSFRNGRDGPVLAGFDELHVDVAGVDPASGGVHVKTVELFKPRGALSMKEDGLHFLGLVVRTPPAPAPEAGVGSEAAKAGETGEPAAAAPAAPSPSPPESPEVKIDVFYISGLDFAFSDDTVDPPLLVPLDDLDVEVKGFTTRAFAEPRPVTFNAVLRAGSVPLPLREKAGGLFGAIGKGVAGLAGGGGEKKVEERNLFEEVTASGRMTLSPAPAGWVKAGVSALELPGFKGPAGKGGVDLEDGLLDAAVDLHFRSDGSLGTEADFTFTDLDLTEPPGGPISTFLELPAPLDMVLFLLRDEDGAIDVPLGFRVGKEGLSTGEVVNTAAKVFGSLVADAVASSPFRVAGTVGDIVPLGGLLPFGGKEEPVKGETAAKIAFGAGDTFLAPSERRKLEPLIEKLEEDENRVLTVSHVLGGGDIAAEALRANPSREDCLVLASRLRKRKAWILEGRREASARARAAYASGLEVEALAARRRLKELDRELGLTEQALDGVLDFLRPGAERQAPRRTRAACVAVAKARIEAVRRAFLERDPALAKRLRIKRLRFGEAEGKGGGSVVIVW